MSVSEKEGINGACFVGYRVLHKCGTSAQKTGILLNFIKLSFLSGGNQRKGFIPYLDFSLAKITKKQNGLIFTPLENTEDK